MLQNPVQLTQGVIRRLWQTYGFEKKVQLWPNINCVIRIIFCP